MSYFHFEFCRVKKEKLNQRLTQKAAIRKRSEDATAKYCTKSHCICPHVEVKLFICSCKVSITSVNVEEVIPANIVIDLILDYQHLLNQHWLNVLCCWHLLHAIYKQCSEEM